MQYDDRNAGEVERWQALYRRMRNIAAGYSNMADENGTTRRLDGEFKVCEEEARVIGTMDDFPTRDKRGDREQFQEAFDALGYQWSESNQDKAYLGWTLARRK